MKQLGAVMSSEIAQTPAVFTRILGQLSAFDAVKNILTTEKFNRF